MPCRISLAARWKTLSVTFANLREGSLVLDSECSVGFVICSSPGCSAARRTLRPRSIACIAPFAAAHFSLACFGTHFVSFTEATPRSAHEESALQSFPCSGELQLSLVDAGGLVSNIGTWMQRVAQDWIVLTQLTTMTRPVALSRPAVRSAVAVAAWSGLARTVSTSASC